MNANDVLDKINQLDMPIENILKKYINSLGYVDMHSLVDNINIWIKKGFEIEIIIIQLFLSLYIKERWYENVNKC